MYWYCAKSFLSTKAALSLDRRQTGGISKEPRTATLHAGGASPFAATEFVLGMEPSKRHCWNDYIKTSEVHQVRLCFWPSLVLFRKPTYKSWEFLFLFSLTKKQASRAQHMNQVWTGKLFWFTASLAINQLQTRSTMIDHQLVTSIHYNIL